MVVIRLARGGAKKRPFYHIVVTDSRKRRDGGYIEQLGYFNPIAADQETRLHFDAARADYWLKQGAKPSQRVASLLREHAKTTAAAA
ncbi:MAG TPA: 30S ribosomal protein S16 [Gammaproteobacteria bacterium]|nr:30S ribosomal protein S16 [Gammaproteobacteria bacterium]